MKIAFISLLLGLIFFKPISAQNDTTQTDDLLGELTMSTQDTTTQLLPKHIIITQRLLWGKKGLMRNFNSFELSPKEREKELKIRRTMLIFHQFLGFLTLDGMIAQGIVGSQLYYGNTKLKSTHEALALGVDITYFTTASLSLFAPPKMLDERKGYSSIKIHRVLAIIHFSSMLATNILSDMLEGNPSLRPYHRAAAFTTLGALAASMIVIKF